MNNAIFQLALFAVEQLIKHAPTLFLEFQKLISKADVTLAEIEAERVRISSQTYESLVPHSRLKDDPMA